MSQENAEIVRRGYEAYERGDVDDAVADFASDCEYSATGVLPGATGVFLGPEGYKSVIAWLRENFDDAHMGLNALVDAGDSVVASVTLRGRGRQSGAAASWTFWQVWTLRSGKIVRGRGFTNEAEALEAARLAGNQE
jgi:ketosteroid isomerase-like protein